MVGPIDIRWANNSAVGNSAGELRFHAEDLTRAERALRGSD